MTRKRLERIEQKLGEGLPKVGIIIRETDPEGNVTEHIQEIKGYRGQPQTVDIDSDDWKL
jgi:hypothetical protein